MVSLMFELIILLACAQSYIEYKVCESFPWVRDLCARNRMVNLGFSLALSGLATAFFGAGGMVVFASGIFSTVMMIPYYVMVRNGSWDRAITKKNELRDWSLAYKDEAFFRLNQVGKMLVFAARVIALPFRVLFWVMDHTMPRQAR